MACLPVPLGKPDKNQRKTWQNIHFLFFRRVNFLVSFLCSQSPSEATTLIFSRFSFLWISESLRSMRPTETMYERVLLKIYLSLFVRLGKAPAGSDCAQSMTRWCSLCLDSPNIFLIGRTGSRAAMSQRVFKISFFKYGTCCGVSTAPEKLHVRPRGYSNLRVKAADKKRTAFALETPGFSNSNTAHSALPGRKAAWSLPPP